MYTYSIITSFNTHGPTILEPITQTICVPALNSRIKKLESALEKMKQKHSLEIAEMQQQKIYKEIAHQTEINQMKIAHRTETRRLQIILLCRLLLLIKDPLLLKPTIWL